MHFVYRGSLISILSFCIDLFLETELKISRSLKLIVINMKSKCLKALNIFHDAPS